MAAPKDLNAPKPAVSVSATGGASEATLLNLYNNFVAANPNAKRDYGNERYTSPGANATWDGAFKDISQFGQGLVLIISDQVLAMAQLQWSADGVTPVSGTLIDAPTNLTFIPPTATSPFNIYFAFITDTRIEKQYRVHVVTGGVAPTLFQAFALLSQNQFIGSFAALTGNLSPQNKYLLTRSVLDQVGIGMAGKALDADTTPSGSLFVEEIRDDVSADWANLDPNLVWDHTTVGTGSVDVVGGNQGRWRTGTTTGSSKVSRSKETIFYASAHGIEAEWTTEFTVPPTTSDGKALIGALTAVCGFAVGYIGTTFGFLHRRGSSDARFTPIANFNVDNLAGTTGSTSKYTKNGAVIAFDPTKEQRWRVVGAWLGAETWALQIRSPDRSWVTVHLIFWINEQVGAIIDTPDLKLAVEVANGTSTTNVELRNGSCRLGLYTSEESDFTKLLQRIVHDTDELRLDVEPTNTDYYVGVGADGLATNVAAWKVMRIYLSATKNPNRMRFRKNVAWDSRTAGWP